MSFKSVLAAAIVCSALVWSGPGLAQSSTLQPFPLGGKDSSTASSKNVKISVSYQFFLEGDTSSMEEQASLADKGRKQLYVLLANECVVLKQTIAETCAIDRANVNAQLRNRNRRQEGVRISGSATYRISLKDDTDEKKN
jgi:CRISPR/Cas system CSM-associated protein Csm3 (group 7 of RAMP superfamily)